MENKPVKSKDLVAFVTDGKSMIGQKVKSNNADSFVVKDPVVVYLQPTEQGQLQVQIFPYWFNELISEEDREKGVEWVFDKHNVTLPKKEFNIDQKLVDQYNRTFGLMPPQQIIQPKGSDQKVVKLFDD